MAQKKLTEKELKKSLAHLQFFTVASKTPKLVATFDFKDHVSALVFIARITVHAEVQQHHPELVYTHKKVKVTLTTNEIKGLSTKDFKLAERIERLITEKR